MPIILSRAFQCVASFRFWFVQNYCSSFPYEYQTLYIGASIELIKLTYPTKNIYFSKCDAMKMVGKCFRLKMLWMDQKSLISNNITREMAHTHCLKYRGYERKNRRWDQTNGTELDSLIRDRFGVLLCHSFTDNIALDTCVASISSIVICFFSS